MPQNCWEYKRCGRQPGGLKTNELGVCPAATEVRVDGVNHGKNAGRCCWVIAGTLCKGEKQGLFAQKLTNCIACDFYQHAATEEGSFAAKSREILKRLS